jgi:hypothetical protein
MRRPSGLKRTAASGPPNGLTKMPPPTSTWCDRFASHASSTDAGGSPVDATTSQRESGEKATASARSSGRETCTTAPVRALHTTATPSACGQAASEPSPLKLTRLGPQRAIGPSCVTAPVPASNSASDGGSSVAALHGQA